MTRLDNALNFLLYAGDKLMRPTLHNLLGGDEELTRRAATERALLRAEKLGWVERTREAKQFVYRLTAEGRRWIEPFDDPREAWNSAWDGLWRVFAFDLPSSERRLRVVLWRWLREHRFGYLQDSVWIRPHPIGTLLETLEWVRENPESFLVLEARRVTGGSDAGLVHGAWDFRAINNAYQVHLDFLASQSPAALGKRSAAELSAIIAKERTLYAHALARDPLLPARLLPSEYLGREAHRARQQFAARVGSRLAAA